MSDATGISIKVGGDVGKALNSAGDWAWDHRTEILTAAAVIAGGYYGLYYLLPEEAPIILASNETAGIVLTLPSAAPVGISISGGAAGALIAGGTAYGVMDATGALGGGSSGHGGSGSGGGGGLPGSSYGESSAQYWANLSINPTNSWYETAAYDTMGGLASLWTPETSGTTATVLSTGAGLGSYLGRPYWRYVGPNSSPNGGWLTRGNGWKAPYGRDFAKAKDALQIPGMPNDVTKVKVPWYEPVLGPRPATKYPEFGSGGGSEYFRGWKWPW